MRQALRHSGQALQVFYSGKTNRLAVALQDIAGAASGVEPGPAVAEGAVVIPFPVIKIEGRRRGADALFHQLRREPCLLALPVYSAACILQNVQGLIVREYHAQVLQDVESTAVDFLHLLLRQDLDLHIIVIYEHFLAHTFCHPFIKIFDFIIDSYENNHIILSHFI